MIFFYFYSVIPALNLTTFSTLISITILSVPLMQATGSQVFGPAQSPSSSLPVGTAVSTDWQDLKVNTGSQFKA